MTDEKNDLGSNEAAPAASMIAGLVRAAELLESHDQLSGTKAIWDDESRKALEQARALGWGNSRIGRLPTAGPITGRQDEEIKLLVAGIRECESDGGCRAFKLLEQVDWNDPVAVSRETCTGPLQSLVSILRIGCGTLNAKGWSDDDTRELRHALRHAADIIEHELVLRARPAPLTERQREGMRRVLRMLSGASGARWDQHLRYEIGDSNAERVIAWVHAELNVLPERKHHDDCNANPKNGSVGHDGLCSMMCAGEPEPDKPVDLKGWL